MILATNVNVEDLGGSMQLDTDDIVSTGSDRGPFYNLGDVFFGRDADPTSYYVTDRPFHGGELMCRYGVTSASTVI
jgi:hypothetical protein